MKVRHVTKGRRVFVKNDVQIPVKRGPIKFAVLMPNGRTSNAWRVWTERSGAYICCRDNMQEIKISLHQSGKQHIAFTRESGIEMTLGSRFWNRWNEPPQQRTAIPSFKLVFPSWGVKLTEEDRIKTSALEQRWNDNQILIEGDDKNLTVVSFVILDDSANLTFSGDYSENLIGILPFRYGKSLYVVSSIDPEGDLRSKVESALPKIDPQLARWILDAQEKGATPVACMSGDNTEGYAYMVVVPLQASAGPN